jgi:hypothetical protein
VTRGVAYSASIAEARHTISIVGNTYAAINTNTPIVGSQYVTAYTNAASSTRYQFSDAIKSNDQLTLDAVGFVRRHERRRRLVSRRHGRVVDAQTPRRVFSLGQRRQFAAEPQRRAIVLRSRLRALQLRSANGVVSGPGDTGDGQKQSATSINAAWAHTFNGGATFSVNAFSQLQSGQLINANIEEPAAYFDAAGAGYLQTLDAAYRAPSVCGVNAPAPAVFVSESVAGTRRLYQGVDLNGPLRTLALHRAVPSYSINLATLEAAGGRLEDGPSTTIVGAQLPNRPIHRGNVSIDGSLAQRRRRVAGQRAIRRLEQSAESRTVRERQLRHLAQIRSRSSDPLRKQRLQHVRGRVRDRRDAQPQPLSNGGFFRNRRARR